MSKIQLPWRPEPVSTLWLRDNCPCPECRVVATNEHRVLIGAESIDLAPSCSQLPDGSLQVDWGRHTSIYTQVWFDEQLAQSDRPLPDPILWDRSLDLVRYQHDDLADGDRLVALADDLARYGVVIVEGVPNEDGMVERFIQRWVPVREVPFGRVHDVRLDPTGYNIAHTSEGLPPHNDMASIQWPPSGQLIHMLVNDASGGDSIVVDGFKICEALDPVHLETLARVPACFRQFSDTAETWARMPLVRLHPDGSIAQLRFSNQLLQAMDPFDDLTDRFYEAYHALSALVLDDSFQHHFRTRAGDMQILHGHRVLHGRTAFQPATGARHLQDTYFEFEDLMNVAFRIRNRTLHPQ